MSNLDKPAPWPRLAIAIALSLQLFVLLPGTIYIGNLVEFITPPGAIIMLLLIPMLLLIAIIFVTGMLLTSKSHTRFISILAGLTVLLWIQSSLYIWDYGPLDGRNIDWNAGAWRGWLDLATWLIVLGLSWRWATRFQRSLVMVAVSCCAIQGISLAISIAKHVDALQVQSRGKSTENALAEMSRFSATRNVLHIILDSFQSDIFKNIVTNAPQSERYRAALDGFIFFEEHLGVFPYTQFALPALLGAPSYHNDMPKREYVQKAFSGNTILNAAFNAGYEVDLASPETLLLDMLARGHHKNLYNTWEGTHITGGGRNQSEALKLLDLSLFRVTPHKFKRYIYADQKWIFQRFLPGTDFLNFTYFTDNFFLQTLTRTLVADRQTPVYKFFHLMNTHAPMVVGPDCSFAGRALMRNRETVTAQSRCSLDYLIALLDQMKKSGIYDNTLIILMGDHGGHIPPDNYIPESVTENDVTYTIDPWLVAMSSPLMLIKPPGAHGEFQVSAAQSSITDTAQTINSIMSLGGTFGDDSILDLSPMEQRTRLFHYYAWQKNDYTTDYAAPIQQFRIIGDHHKAASWHLGEKYPTPKSRAR